MRLGSTGTAGAPKLGIGPGTIAPGGGIVANGGPGGSRSGPSLIIAPPPAKGIPPPQLLQLLQLLQVSHGQGVRPRNILIRLNRPPPPPQPPQGLAHPAASKTPTSVA